MCPSIEEPTANGANGTANGCKLSILFIYNPLG